MNRLARVRVTAGPFAGREGVRVCRASDQVFVAFRLPDGTVDQVPVNEYHIQALGD